MPFSSMAPKGKNRKLKTVKFVEDEDKGEDDNSEVEEDANKAEGKDDDELDIDEVLRLGGTKVRKHASHICLPAYHT